MQRRLRDRAWVRISIRGFYPRNGCTRDGHPFVRHEKMKIIGEIFEINDLHRAIFNTWLDKHNGDGQLLESYGKRSGSLPTIMKKK